MTTPVPEDRSSARQKTALRTRATPTPRQKELPFPKWRKKQKWFQPRPTPSSENRFAALVTVQQEQTELEQLHERAGDDAYNERLMEDMVTHCPSEESSDEEVNFSWRIYQLFPVLARTWSGFAIAPS